MGEEPRGMVEMRKVREELRKHGDGPRSSLSPDERLMRILLSELRLVLTATENVCTELDKFLDATDPFSSQYESGEKVLTATRTTLQMAQRVLNQVPDKVQGIGQQRKEVATQ